MNMTVSDRIHGIIDYTIVVIFALAPTVFGFEGAAEIVSYSLAGIHLLMSLVSAMPYGAISIISMRFHGIVELVVGVLLVTVPWFAPTIFATGGLFFTMMGCAILIVWAISCYGQAFAAGARLDQSA